MNVDVRAIIKQHDIRPIRSLGQNFLVNKQIQKRIIEAADLQKDDLIIEIGAGLGILSKEISKKAGALVAVEIDKYLIPTLKEVLKDCKNVRIINEDILRLDIKNDIILKVSSENEKRGFVPEHTKAIGNLPYYITTPIIMKLLENDLGIGDIVFMVQKEVAQRITASPGTKEYGSLSLAVQYYSRAEILFNVPPSAFYPKPKVDSSVIKLTIYKTPPIKVIDKILFFKIIRASFGQRRKTLQNALYNSKLVSIDKNKIRDILTELGINENARGETLSMNEFALLSNKLSIEQVLLPNKLSIE